MKNLIAKSLSVTNDVGGTTTVQGRFLVSVLSSWNDYENGRHYKCKLVNPNDVANVRTKATTGFTPDSYKQYIKVNPDLYYGALKAQKEFDPSIVYVSQFDIISKEKI